MGANYSDWIKLKQQLENTENELDLFIEQCSKELAQRLLTKVIKRTITGEYPKGSGKVGGTLKRGWTGGKAQSAIAYAQSLKVDHIGNRYVVEVINKTEYASYVEFGHRTRNHKGWVKGKFMLTISEQEIESVAPQILEKKIQKKLGEAFK